MANHYSNADRALANAKAPNRHMGPLSPAPESNADPATASTTAERPSGLGSRHLALIDASQAAEAQSWVPITYRQLTAGQFHGHMDIIDLRDVAVFYECHDQSVNKSGALPAGQCTLSFINQGHKDARFCQFHGQDVVFFQPEQHEFDIVMPGGRANTYVRIDQSALIRDLHILDASLADCLGQSRSLESLGLAGKARLHRVMQEVITIAKGPGTGRDGADPAGLRAVLIEQILLAIIVSGRPLSGDAPHLHGRRRAWRIARAAREFMEDCLHRGITPGIVDLCAHLHVSERTLRYAFNEQMGCPPGTYLRRLRLNGVRAELLHPGTATTSVTAAATRWGFLQMGHFSRDYRTLFHEKPSVTLARALHT
jgi:AraC-like DNA-binding protein